MLSTRTDTDPTHRPKHLKRATRYFSELPMPRYSYECPECGKQATLQVPIARRDKVACHECSVFRDEDVRMRRQPDAPNFTIKGFSAKNGYSK